MYRYYNLRFFEVWCVLLVTHYLGKVYYVITLCIGLYMYNLQSKFCVFGCDTFPEMVLRCTRYMSSNKKLNAIRFV